MGGFNPTFYKDKYPIEWVANLKLLGVSFYLDSNQSTNQNYKTCLNKIEKQIKILRN